MTQGLTRERPRRLALDSIPEMARPMRLYGTQGRTEVGGSICFGIVVTMTMYASA